MLPKFRPNKMLILFSIRTNHPTGKKEWHVIKIANSFLAPNYRRDFSYSLFRQNFENKKNGIIPTFAIKK